MKDKMKEIEGRVKFSTADSTMMLLVQQAMDKAHENIKTKKGLLLRLNAISIFYELAVLQLESCLSFVKQETDKLERNHEEVVRDMREIKERLHHRLLETESAILEKDRELLEMSENQKSLRDVLESKETELVHLQDLERSRSRNMIGDFIKEDEFTELKSSVDKQVMNLRQKLATEYDEKREDADIDVLKGTTDLAFNKMHQAMFLSELGPIEQSWRWSIERDSMGILIKGFMNGVEEKLKKVRDYESGFKDQVCSIRREVECLESEIDQIIIKRTSSSPRSYDDREAKEDEEEEEQDSSNYPVSKLIKSHESIIRKKSEELVPLKTGSIKRQKSGNISSSKRAIDDIVAGLDSLISLNTKLLEHLYDDRYDYDHGEVVMDDNLDDVWMKMQKNRKVFSDNRIEEKEDAEMKLLILEETYLTLLRGFITEEGEEKIEPEIKCMDCLENFNRKKDSEIDEEIRQELNWIIVTELVREVLENSVKIEANNKRLLVEETNRACLKISLVYEDFDFKIQEKLKIITFRLQNMEIEIDSMMDCVAELRRKELVCRTAFVLTSENLRKSETEKNRLVFSDSATEEKEDAEIEPEMDCIENLNREKEAEILLEDQEIRQELNWIIVTELLREVLENRVKIEAYNKRMLEEEVNRACLKVSLIYEDFDFKIQEKLKIITFRLQDMEIEIDSMMDYILELRRKESVCRRAFVLTSENLRKAETEVDLLGDQVDSLVKLLQITLWTFNKHPTLLCNNSDISKISKMIEEELTSEDS